MEIFKETTNLLHFLFQIETILKPLLFTNVGTIPAEPELIL